MGHDACSAGARPAGDASPTSVPHLSRICPASVPHLSRTCLAPVPHLSCICPPLGGSACRPPRPVYKRARRTCTAAPAHARRPPLRIALRRTGPDRGDCRDCLRRRRCAGDQSITFHEFVVGLSTFTTRAKQAEKAQFSFNMYDFNGAAPPRPRAARCRRHRHHALPPPPPPQPRAARHSPLDAIPRRDRSRPAGACPPLHPRLSPPLHPRPSRARPRRQAIRRSTSRS